jgi:general secretion pathway protein G
MIELLVVLAIIAMLALLVAPTVMNNRVRGQRTTAQAQMANLATALDTYRLDLSAYPQSLDGLVENDTTRGAWAGPYIKEVPLDPWGNAYVYSAANNSFTLQSYGADGAPGGEGDDADLTH